jgi:hypothetical protein
MAERPAASSRPVAQKLLLKPGSHALVLNAPPGYLDQFPSDARVSSDISKRPFDFIQLFATQRTELLEYGPKLREAMAPAGLLWVSYPKGKSVPTDLNRDIVRTTLADIGLEVVTQVAVDDTWSALRAKRV